jgi:hypothetical protein
LKGQVSVVAMDGELQHSVRTQLKGAARRSGVLGRSLVWLVPIVMTIQALIYGNLVPSQEAGRFPIVRLATFSIRLEELLIICGFALWLLTWAPAIVSDPGILDRLTPVSMLSVLAVGGLVQAAVHGLRANTFNNLMEARVLVTPLLYFALALYWAPRIRLTCLARRLRFVLLPTVVVLTLGVLTPLNRTLEELLTVCGGIYGGNATALEPMVVFVICLLWTRLVSRHARRRWAVVLLLFLMAGMVVKIGKTNWVYVLEVPLLVFVVEGKGYLQDGRQWIARKQLAWIVCVALLLLVAAVGWFRVVRPETLDSFVTRSKERITRPDADDDWSGGRFTMNKEGLEKVLEAPILGNGLGFWYEFYWHGVPHGKMPDHFSPLWLTIRGGLVTSLPVLILCLWYMREGYRVCGHVANPELQRFVTACYVYTLAMLVYSLYGVPQGLFEPMILFWLSVAVVLRARHHFENRAPMRARPLAVRRRSGDCPVSCFSRESVPMPEGSLRD